MARKTVVLASTDQGHRCCLDADHRCKDRLQKSHPACDVSRVEVEKASPGRAHPTCLGGPS
jgi:hypothetical protein